MANIPTGKLRSRLLAELESAEKELEQLEAKAESNPAFRQAAMDAGLKVTGLRLKLMGMEGTP